MALDRETTFPDMKPPPVTLFLGDLQRLHKLALPTLKKASYTCKGFSAADPEALRELREHLGTPVIKELTIKWDLETGYLRISLGKYALISGSDKPEIIGLAARVMELLQARRRIWLSRFITTTSFGMPLFAMGLPALLADALLFVGTSRATISVREIVLRAGVGVAYTLLTIVLAVKLNGPRVHLYHRSEHQGLFGWADTKSIIVGVVTALATAAAVLAIQKITGWSPD